MRIEAILIPYQLPPVGDSIRLRAGRTTESPQALFSPYTPYYYASGTAALAAGIKLAIRIQGKPDPEIILPAYGCPDLVSATLHAGAKPVLVDLEAERPWLDLEQLKACIDTNTVAVVAAHWFGIRERMKAIRRITDRTSTLVIEDSAQAFPMRADETFWHGDLVVLSFGRGKPVGLLGGGALLIGHSKAMQYPPEPPKTPANRYSHRSMFWLRGLLYNLMISPYLYWLPESLPFLQLGATRYRSLPTIDAIDPARRRRLSDNIRDYQADAMDPQQALIQMLNGLDGDRDGWVDLPARCGHEPDRRLLRYPLLVAAPRRDRLYRALKRQGLGPSTMYPASMPNLPGMGDRLAGQGPFPRAEEFAARLLTLPTHSRVTETVVERIARVLVSAI